ncbi:MAG: TlpA family protein disulfide reductase [Limisphaerales bacterium]
MKIKVVVAAAILALCSCAPRGQAAEKGDAAAELKTLVTKVKTKLQEGKTTEADLALELKEFGALLESHKGEKTEDVARILYMEAQLYLQVMENPTKGIELVEQLKTDFPDTSLGKKAPEIVEAMKKQEAAQKIQKGLIAGSAFPDFDEKDVAGKPVSIAKYKGKVVLIDFWATWCGPCVHELPNVIKAYEKHHEKGFEIIGVSLDKDKEKLTSFTEEKKMAWQQYFDGKGWGNKLAEKYGIQSIPATFLLDGNGKIIGRDLRGEALEEAVTKALGQQKID